MAANLSQWPHAPHSNLVDPTPNWREVNHWTDWPIGRIRQVSVESLRTLTELNLFEFLDPVSREAISNIVNGKPVTVSCDLILTAERLTSLVDQSNRTEIARASIDALALFKLAATAIETGDLTGTPLTGRDKIDLIKFMINKVTPDAKSQEMNEVSQRIDRGRKTASQFTDAELKALTHQELLDLLGT